MSLLSFFYYFQRGEILLYGDAVAHINIARRVLDSQTPGLLQLGTVWLPLPHLLMIPLLFSDWMWRSGVGGSIPSMIAYVLGVVGIFRFTRGLLEDDGCKRAVARAGAGLAAVVYGANPNLIYLQTTAMTEVLYLALFIWAVVFFAEFLVEESRGPSVRLTGSETRSHTLYRCALCVAGAELTRYDGWFLAVVVGATVVWMLVRRWSDRAFRRVAVKFLVGIVAAPMFWLGYNGAVYGNPLEFANGPYSAKAIEQRTASPGYPAHPGAGSVVTAGSYFLKSAELNMAEGNWGRIWIVVALAGLVLVRIKLRSRGAVLLLWVPIVFYALSIAYGGVPLFLPAWWPYTWYNLRYGLQLLPLFAVSAALVVSALSARSAPEGASEKGRPASSRKRWPDTKLQMLAVGAVVVVAGLNYFSVWRAQPLCFKEAWVNSRTKLALESSVAQTVTTLPRNSQYLMYLGDHVGVFQQAGVPLRRVINEGNHRPWKKPSDSEGLWERALADPARHVDFVIAYDGDAVDQAVEKSSLTLVTEIHILGQPRARIYAARSGLNQSR
ncbi:MAG: hypothetical protein HY233_03665 [Acidobacteriales bacterium]|nr:hypothetical protein [Terriglobales bacterium]